MRCEAIGYCIKKRHMQNTKPVFQYFPSSLSEFKYVSLPIHMHVSSSYLLCILFRNFTVSYAAVLDRRNYKKKRLAIFGQVR